MIKLNWHNTKKELPTLLVGTYLTKDCLVIINIKGTKKMRVDQCIWACGKWRWANSIDKNVTHWIYLDEIPLPEE